MGKPKARAGRGIDVDRNAQPAAVEYLVGLAGDVAAGERVQNKRAWLRQKANEEIRQLGRKAGGVDGQAGRAAVDEIFIVRARVGNGQQVGWNGAAVVFAEMRADLVLRGT